MSGGSCPGHPLLPDTLEPGPGTRDPRRAGVRGPGPAGAPSAYRPDLRVLCPERGRMTQGVARVTPMVGGGAPPDGWCYWGAVTGSADTPAAFAASRTAPATAPATLSLKTLGMM